MIGFLRWDINICSTSVKKQVYTSLIRPSFEYASSVWVYFFCLGIFLLSGYISSVWVYFFCLGILLLSGYTSSVWVYFFCLGIFLLSGYISSVWKPYNKGEIDPTQGCHVRQQQTEKHINCWWHATKLELTLSSRQA